MNRLLPLIIRGRALLSVLSLALFSAAAMAQGTASASLGSFSDIPSDGTFGADTNAVVVSSVSFDSPVRGFRLSGELLRTSSLTLPSEAAIQIIAPTGQTFDVSPVSGPPTGSRWTFYGTTFASSVVIPAGTGDWTVRFYETADQPGEEDARWESIQIDLLAEAPQSGPLANDSLLAAQPIAAGSSVTFSTIGATTDGLPVACQAGLHPQDDVWFSYSAAATEMVSLSTCGASSFDSVIAVYDAGLAPIACNDDGCGVAGGPAAVEFQAIAGAHYMIQLGGPFAGTQGTGVLTVQSTTAGPPACLAAPSSGNMSGHTWPNLFCDPCTWKSKYEVHSVVYSSPSTFTTRYEEAFAFDKDCLLNATSSDHVRYAVVFWVSAGANQPWLVKVDTRRQGRFIMANDGPNAATFSLNPVSGYITSFVPIGNNNYVAGNAAIYNGTLATGTNYGWSEGSSSCADFPFLDASSAIISGSGSQSVHLNFLWDGSISSGDPGKIEMGAYTAYYYQNGCSGSNIDMMVSNLWYYGCIARNPSPDGHFVTVSCMVPNDLCERCTPISFGTTSGTNVGATNDGSSTCPNGAADVFYCFDTVCGGPTTIDTCGSNFDTILSVHSGCPATAANQLACNDDAFTGLCAGGPTSALTFNAAPCTRYYIRVAGFAGEQGNIILHLLQPATPAPANDLCANATPVGNGVFAYSTCGATTDGTGCPAQRDVWFKYRPSCYSTITVSPCGSPCMNNPNTKALYQVYEGPCGTLKIVPEGLQGCRIINTVFGCPDPPRAYVFLGSPCKDYYIRIGTSGNNGGYMSGNMLISAAAPSNDTCANALPIGVGITYGGTPCATQDGQATCGASNATRDVWYAYTPACSGQVTVSTCPAPECGARFDTVLSIYKACPGNYANQVVCNDDDPAFCPTFGLASRVTFTAQACIKYLIRVSGFAGSNGNFALSVGQSTAAPVNDLCASATAITANTSLPFSTCQANTDGPAVGCPLFNDVWFKFVACSAGPFAAATCWSPAGQDTSVSVHTGTCGGLSTVACNDNNGSICPGILASVTFNTVTGQTYYVRVGSPTSGVGVCGVLTLIGTNPATPACPPGGVTSTKMYQIIGGANGVPFVYRLSSLCCFDLCRTHPGVTAGFPASAIAASWATHINAQCGPNLSASTSGDYIIIKTKGCAPNSLQLAVGPNGTPCGSLCVVTSTSLPTSGPCAFNPDILEVPLSGHDCNGNGEDDTIDILNGASQDLDGDGEPDECERLAGDFDQLQTAGQPADALSIRPDFAAFLGRPGGDNAVFHNGAPLGFDEFDPDHWAFGYTFLSLPRIAGGRLRLHVTAATIGAGQDNDTLSLRFIGPGSFAWTTTFAALDALAGGDGQWTPGDDAMLTLDLASLPQSGGLPLSLIAAINQSHDLDVYIQNNTSVDFLELSIDQSAACPADWNSSGTLSVQDIFDFLASYFSGDPRADFNNSATISVQDIFDFLAAYFAGCP